MRGRRVFTECVDWMLSLFLLLLLLFVSCSDILALGIRAQLTVHAPPPAVLAFNTPLCSARRRIATLRLSPDQCHKAALECNVPAASPLRATESSIRALRPSRTQRCVRWV